MLESNKFYKLNINAILIGAPHFSFVLIRISQNYTFTHFRLFFFLFLRFEVVAKMLVLKLIIYNRTYLFIVLKALK